MAEDYVLDRDSNVYRRVDQGAFPYSDGDAVESYIHKTIFDAQDVSTASEELGSKIHDWATLYHLSSARSNLLRPLEHNLRGKRVLELGSGCGAISRYLGEIGCQLTCVEGSAKRAAITAARCRGLENVRVYNDNFQEFEAFERFDVVTLIGVLEYSRKFIKAEDPIKAALQLAQSFLAEDGVLLVAIENKLGLKYWAGAYEDHLGVPFFGIESLYGSQEAVTFGRRELDGLLQGVGFSGIEFFYPYPDYKLPGLVISDLGLQEPTDSLYNLLSSCFAPNQSGHYQRIFSEGAAYRAVIENGLLGDLANSFLVVAKKGSGNWQSNETDIAFSFSQGRRKSLSKEVCIKRSEQGAFVNRRLLYPSSHSHILDFPDSEAFRRGELLFNQLLPLVNRQGWSIGQLAEWLRPLLKALVKYSKQVGRQYVLPGRFFDATPFNLINDSGKYEFIDLEWAPQAELDLSLVLFRGVFFSLARVGSVAQPSPGTPLNISELAARTVHKLSGQAVDVDACLAREVDFQKDVSLARLSVEGLRASTLEVRIQPTRLLQAYNEAKRTISSLQSGKPVQQEAPENSGDYLSQWLAQRLPSEHQNHLIANYLGEHQGGPIFGVLILDLEGDSKKLMTTIQSLGLDKTLYATVKIIAFTTAKGLPQTSVQDKLHFVSITAEDHVAALNQAVADSSFDWLMLVSAGETFTPSGLMMAALELVEAPECQAIYGDELQLMPEGILGGAFRPSFNLDLLLSFPATMARHWLIRREVFLSLGGYDAGYAQALEFDFVLRLIEQEGMAGIGHVDEPLLLAQTPVLQDCPVERATLLRHLAVRGYDATLVDHLPGRYRIDYRHASQPLVSIIVSVGDHLARVQRCVESVLELTTYPNYEILMVDNNSQSAETRQWLAGIEGLGEARLRVLRNPKSDNVAAINNLAAAEAQGDYLLLLNQDAAVVDGGWLQAMLNHAQRPEVGVVGAKLLCPQGRIQHAGLILGLRGPANQPFDGASMDAPGYMHRLQVDQNYSAVSDACLMVRKSIYEAVGGMDEAFAVSYADVDLCLRIGQAGLLIVWTPHARLLHEERQNAGTSDESRKRVVAEQDEMYRRWLKLLARDPSYNRNLSLNGKGFDMESDLQLTWRPLTWRPLPVFAVHPADPYGCGNYRMIRPFKALKQEGLAEGLLSPGLLQLIDVERFDPDAIIMQRQISNERIEAMRRMKAFSRAFKVYELDDYMPNLPLKSVHRRDLPKDVIKSLRKGLGYVDRFVVSTEPLAEALSGFHSDIRIVKNRLPVEWWGELSSQRRRGPKPRVGWAGGAGHTGDLELIADVVQATAHEVDWVFFGLCPERLRPYVSEVHSGVDIERYPAALASLDLDLAVAPLEQNLFNECKSNLRLLEYGACGFPVICSDIRCYEGDLPVTRVKNRFKEWVDAIRAHTSDLDEASRLGDALRGRVMQDWMLEGENLLAWRNAWLPD